MTEPTCQRECQWCGDTRTFLCGKPAPYTCAKCAQRFCIDCMYSTCDVCHEQVLCHPCGRLLDKKIAVQCSVCAGPPFAWNAPGTLEDRLRCYAATQDALEGHWDDLLDKMRAFATCIASAERTYDVHRDALRALWRVGRTMDRLEGDKRMVEYAQQPAFPVEGDTRTAEYAQRLALPVKGAREDCEK